MNDVIANPLSAQTHTTVDFGTPHRFLDIGDDEVAYWRAGSGPDLILVHGWPLHAATWRDLLPRLTRHFTCHLIDLPGAGHTRSATDRPLGLAAHKRTLIGAIDALGIERCAMLAHDSGAAITRLAAAELGDRVWALVMGNTEFPGHRPWLVMLFGVLAKLGGHGAFTTLLKSRTLRHSYIAYGSCFQNTQLIDGAFHTQFVAPMLASPSVTKGQMRLLEGFDWADVDNLEQTHERISAPVQMIWGENDPYFPLAKAKHMSFPGGSELEVIRNTKLFAHEEAPSEFVAHAVTFLRKHGPSAR